MRVLTIAIAALALAGCGGSGGGPELIPNFQLRDQNPSSSTFDTDVSPRDQLGLISAWYFGYAT